MSTVLSRKCVQLVYGFLVLFLVTKCIESAKRVTYPPYKYPSYQATTLSNKYTTTTTKKPKSSTDSEELLTIIEDQSKLLAPEVHPSNHDPCVLGSAELYLSWWINENGSLAVPDDKGRNSFYSRHVVYGLLHDETVSGRDKFIVVLFLSTQFILFENAV